MPDSDNPPTREYLFDLIGNASLFGYLGLFVGTGFSKAATMDGAPNFNELIGLLVRKFGPTVDIDSDPLYRHKSLPQIASELIKVIDPPERAGELLREEVAHICNLSPQAAIRSNLASSLRGLGLSWVITTNYDLILEALLDDSVSVLPDQPLVARPDRVPIYHLHGHRLSPPSIKITEEDYVGLLGPVDYQRLKLPLILLESTTVMLGYSLGDINVRAAMAWASSFRGVQGVQLSSGQGVIIQALYTEGRAPRSPYSGPNGEWILEISDIHSFLTDLADRRAQLAQALADARAALIEFLSNPSMATEVASSGPARETFLRIVEESLPFAQAGQFVDFLNRMLDPIWERARENNQFRYYDVYLNLVMDILSRIEVGQCNPALIGYLADALDRVGWYIDPKKHYGTAWAATDAWLAGHSAISDSIKAELRSYAQINWRSGLKKMLSFVP